MKLALPCVLFILLGRAVTLSAQTLPNTLPLMPWPRQMTVHGGTLDLGRQLTFFAGGDGALDARVQKALPRFVDRLTRQTGLPVAPAARDTATLNILITRADHPQPQRLGDEEGYALAIENGRIVLTADAPLGALRGFETLLQLVQHTEDSGAVTNSLPLLTIHDEPRFLWRGLSFDVSRHFMPVAEVKRTLDGMAAVKLNVLHWHLSDDEGFRVESKTFPRLQQAGSDGMYYSQAEVRDVIQYAADRGVRVVPEFDMPGHSTSILAAYPAIATGAGPFHVVHDRSRDATSVMDPTKEEIYEFLDGFISEMAALFPDDYFHIGGDEVSPRHWNSSPRIRAFMAQNNLKNAAALQAYFNRRVASIVARNKKHMIGWDEILQPDLAKSIAVQSWRGQPSLWQAARAGHQAILSAGYYLDLMYPASYHYAVDPLRLPAHSGFAAPLTVEQRRLILGGEAAMWEELASAENIDAKLWPRLAAIAERLWSSEPVTDVTSMYRRLQATSVWLEGLGLKHRTNLTMMHKRLADPFPQAPLDAFASLLEPVKGYARHSEKYGIFTPLNRLVDSIPPESDAAREFQNAVAQYLASPKNSRDSSLLRERLTAWSDAAKSARPILQANPLLRENTKVAEDVAVLCRAAADALNYLDSGGAATPLWRRQTLLIVNKYVNTSVGDLLIPIAPGVQKLVSAVPTALRRNVIKPINRS